MKRILLIFALILTLSAACFAFTACGDDTQSDPGDNSAEPEKDEISFKTLEVNGTNVYGRVSKDTASFGFINEIATSGKAKYTVALDIYGMQPVATKTVALNPGDNTFYVIEMVDDEATEVYTVVIHRNEVYEVSFDTAGLVTLKTQYIEEGFFATEPTTNITARLGYEFLGWDFDFTKPITGDVVVKAKIELKDEMKNFKFTSTTTSCEITGLKDKTVTELVIPDYVTSIGSSAFYDCDSLTSVTIGNGVKSIDGYAFEECDSLTSVTIGNSVTSIGKWAFRGCDKLVEVINHSSLDITAGSSSNGYITYYAIEVHKGESKVVNYNDYLFYTDNNGVNYLFGYVGEDTALVLPESYKGENYKIYNYAFHERKDITSATIPDSVTSIGERAFYNCDSLTSATIPDNVTSIGERAFSDCDSLASVTIGNSVTSIGERAFSDCTSLTSVTIPDSVTSIGEDAFKNCSALKSLVIGNGVTTLPKGLLSGCSSLESLTIPFVGGSKTATSASSSTLFGYIFGTSSYIGSTPAEQYYSSGSYTTYYIPSSLRNVTITEGDILFGAFYNCSSLTSVTIPDSVTSIGDYAFNYCTSLKSVTIPDSVTSIGERAFYYCRSLTSVTIGNSVTSIGDYAFYSCDSLTSVTIGNSVTSIGEYAFYDCDSLTSVTIENSVTSIGNYAFYDCTSLTSVTIPNSVTSIGKYAFSDCSSLTSVTIPDSVKSIGSSAFYGCYNLTIYCEAASEPSSWSSSWNYSNRPVVWDAEFGITDEGILWASTADKLYIIGYCGTDVEVVIPASIKGKNATNISSYAFSSCTSLTSVTIPDSVTSIGSSAFWNCTSLTSVTIGNSVTSIGNNAFQYCYKLVEVINHSSLDITAGNSSNGYVGYYAIEVHKGESKIVNYNDYLFYTYDGVNYLLGYVGEDKALVLPESYNGEKYEIYDYAFYGRDDITSVVIPKGVISIGSYAFAWCDSLTSVTIGNSVTSIGSSAFRGCTGLTSVVIPDSVTSIGSSAFSGCYKLVEVINHSSLDITAGKSSSHGYVGYYAKEVHKGESKIVNYNDYLLYTYDGVNYLLGYVGKDTALVLPESYKGENYEIYKYAFYKRKDITSVVVSNGVTGIGDYAFEYCTSLTSVTIPDSVTIIGDYAFDDCTGLTSVTIPDSVTSIGDSAFSGCTSLTSVTIGNSVKSIGHGAFYKCTGLTSVTIPDSVTSIGDSAFSGCTSLTSVTIGNSVTSIGYRAFYSCDSLTSVTIHDSVTSIGAQAFLGCTSLTSVTIPDSVTSIDYGAFRDCTRLTIYCEAARKPSGWSSDWNSTNRPVVWNYKG